MATRSVPRSFKPAYDSADLAMFQEATDKVLARLIKADNYPLEPGVTEVLRLQIASTVFECAELGQGDPAKLQQLVLERFWKPAGRSLAS
jgi:hypothetical protein